MNESSLTFMMRFLLCQLLARELESPTKKWWEKKRLR
jgi:hypothetical protein